MAGNDSKHRRLHESVNVQGLEQICDTNSGPLRRVVWFLVFTGGLVFTSFNIYNQVLLYMSTPITVRVDELIGKSLPFPTITICSNNRMSKSAMKKFGITPEAALLIYPYTDFEEDPPNVTVSELATMLSFIQETPIAFITQLAPSYESMLLKCDWKKKPCGLDRFTNTLTDMGLCVSFNGNGTRYAQNSGRAYGLRVVLDVDEDDYVRSSDGFVGTGFMVAVHPPEVPPIMSEIGIAVDPGQQHFIGLKVKMHTSNQGIGVCGSKKLDYSDANYSREACRLECKGNHIIKHCNCLDFSIPHNSSYCNVEQYTKCLVPTLEKYLKKGKECESKCPEPCSYNKYTTQHSSSPLSRDYITQFTKAKGQTEENWRSNLVILEVYMSSMAYEHMEKQLGYEILDLFCDIGGAMGLFLGASIITVLEVVDYVCLRALSRVYGTKKTTRVDVISVK